MKKAMLWATLTALTLTAPALAGDGMLGVYLTENTRAMNGALIGIGLRSAGREKKAVAVARRIGVVEVDHGETGCKTPDAAGYIAKTKAHRAKRGR